jgi:hypothetical protein
MTRHDPIAGRLRLPGACRTRTRGGYDGYQPPFASGVRIELWSTQRIGSIWAGEVSDRVNVERQASMTVANLKIGKRNFVVVPERDFDRMRRENQQYHRLLSEDSALGNLAEKELKAFRKSGGKGTPWAEVRKELGL